MPDQSVLKLQFLSRLSFVGSKPANFTNAQWAALVYFQRFNNYSRTVGGFASFHSTTRASSSQTINGLVKRGLLRRVPNPQDQRSVLFELTEDAKSVTRNGRQGALSQAMSLLSKEQLTSLENTLHDVLVGIYEPPGQPIPGKCEGCGHFRERTDLSATEMPKFCTRLRVDLAEEDMKCECIHHTTARQH